MRVGKRGGVHILGVQNDLEFQPWGRFKSGAGTSQQAGWWSCGCDLINVSFGKVQAQIRRALTLSTEPSADPRKKEMLLQVQARARCCALGKKMEEGRGNEE